MRGFVWMGEEEWIKKEPAMPLKPELAPQAPWYLALVTPLMFPHTQFIDQGVPRPQRDTPLKINPRSFIWPKSMYYCDLSLTNCTFVELESREQGTNLYGDAGEFDERRGINLEIWSKWLYHGTDDKLALVVTVASIVTGILGQLQ